MSDHVQESIDELPLVLVASDVQRVLRLGRVQTYELLNSAGFPAIRCGRVIRVPKHLFIEWLKERASAEKQP
jgi:hypothetical protein